MNGIDPGEAKSESNDGCRRDDRVKASSVWSLCFEGGMPSKGFSYSVGRRAGQHGYSQHPSAYNSQCEQQERQITSQWP